MTGSSGGLGYQRHGLYYPYFHIRDDRWLKAAALYWPKIVRIVPDSYETQDSDTAKALADDFIVKMPPGGSVEAIAPLFTDLIANHASELRERYSATSPPTSISDLFSTLGPGPEWALKSSAPDWPPQLSGIRMASPLRQVAYWRAPK